MALLIQILPYVAEEDCFALKGGTAINLFVRDMPRLSMDIDLTYLPVSSRKESLTAIDAAMNRIAQRIRKAVGGVHITVSETMPEKAATKLLVRRDGVQVKIESDAGSSGLCLRTGAAQRVYFGGSRVRLCGNPSGIVRRSLRGEDRCGARPAASSISSIYAIFSPTKASTTRYAAHLSSIY